MIGAIIGDIVGSRFEFNNHKNKEFDLFTTDCFATDDSIMSLAVAKAIIEAEKIKNSEMYNHDFYNLLRKLTVRYMQQIGRKYPYCGFGGTFAQWVNCENPKPYNSFGNGAAMRISPAGFAARTEDEVRKLSEAVTDVTHNHPEGIKGAEATAIAIFMARKGFTKQEIRERINRDYYLLNFKIDDIRDTYRFNETCQETVPQAIEAFLESVSFEDAIRTAISVGGDSDTLAAITGGISEAYYGVPKRIREKALTYLDDELRRIYNEWAAFAGDEVKSTSFRFLTKYIGKISASKTFGEWIIDKKNDGTMQHPIQIPFVGYDSLVNEFEKELYQFSDNNPEFRLTNYGNILESNGIRWGRIEMQDVVVDNLDAQCVLALLMGAVRAERFCDGALLGFFENGCILKWLKRLKDIDEAEHTIDASGIN